MADDAPRTEPAPRRTDGPTREPAIRTMRSDISEFLKTTKPSLVSLLARQAQWEEYRPPKLRRWLWVGAAGGAILLAAILWLSWRILLPPARPQPAVPAATEPYFRFDGTSDATTEGAPQAFRVALNAVPGDPPGTFTRVSIRIRGSGEPDLPTFLNLAGGRLPVAFMESVSGAPQLFRYRTPGGRSELGLAVEARNPARALQSLLAAEPSLAGDLAFLSAGSQPPALTPYGDITYRNISFRFLGRGGEADRGFGYLLFPATRLIVMATSEETIRAVIDRLFAGR